MFRHEKNMDIQLEVKEKVMCLDYFCVAQAALEAILEKIGVGAKIQTDNVKELAELINNDFFEEYTFYVPYNTSTLKITIYSVRYDVIECQLEGCEGYLSVEFEVSGDSNIKEVIRKLLRDIGADVKICE